MIYTDTPSHLRPMLDLSSRDRLIGACANVLSCHYGELGYNALACCGISGTVFGVSLSDRMRLPLVIVRKDGDQCHSWNSIEGPDRCDSQGNPLVLRWIFVDDTIASGRTFRRVHNAVACRYPQSICAGIMLYEGTGGLYDEDGTRPKLSLIPRFSPFGLVTTPPP